MRTSKLIGLLVSVVAVVASCGDDGQKPDAQVVDSPTGDAPVAGPAVLTISPLTSNFGSVATGVTSPATTFTVTNTGESTSATISTLLSNTTDFRIASNTCATLAPAATCVIGVEFRPSSVGAKTSTLQVSAGTSSVMAGLDGMGIVPGALGITPGFTDLGSVLVGATGTTTATITVSNTGSNPTGALTVQPTGANPSEFTFTGCSGQTLAGGASCTITATFRPTTAGSKSASVTVIGNPGGTVISSVSGIGLAPAQLAMVPVLQDFGSVVAGANATAVFNVSNIGGSSTGTLTHTIAGGDAASFSVVTTTCDGVTLAAGANCSFVVRFEAGAVAGAKSSTLTLAGTPGGSVTATLQGSTIASGALVISPSTQPFGNITVGQTTGPSSFTITNTSGTASGALATSLGGMNAGEFQIVSGSDLCAGVILAANGTCSISVVFGPATTGLKSATLIVAGSPGGTVTSGLSGNATPGAQLTVAPTSKDFGTLGINGTPSPYESFLITNTGGVASGALTVSLTGSNAFSQINDCTAPLAPLGTCTVQVRFAPTAIGSAVGSLTVTGAAGGSTTANLFGTGATAAQITVLPASLSFNGLVGSTSAAQTFTIQNNGATTTGTLSFAVTGTEYTVTHNCTTLAPGATCTGTVTFAATALGTRTATLTVSGTPGGTATVALSGNARGRLEIVSVNAVAPTDPYDFGNVVVDVASPPTAVIVVRNNTATTQTLSTITGFPAPAQYTIVSTTCNGAVAANGTCTATVAFDPTVVAPALASVTFSIGAGANNQVVQNLTGVGIDALSISAVTTSDFGNVANGTTAPALNFIVRNATTGSTTSPITVSIGAPFTISATTCTGAMLIAGGTCSVSVTYSPVNVGPNSDTLRAMATVGGNAGLTVSATSVPNNGLIFNPTPVAFGNVFSGLTRDLTLTVTNPAGAQATGPLAISLPGSTPFQILTPIAGDCTVGQIMAGGDVCTIRLRYSAPAAFGLNTTTLTVTASPGTPVGGAAISLTGTSQSGISILPTTYDFGLLQSGDVATHQFNVRNDSAGPVTLGTAVLGGTTVAMTISADTCSGQTVLPSQTCTVTVRFAPTVLTDNTASLTISTTSTPVNGTAVASPILARGNNRAPTAALLSVTSVEENKVAGVIGSLTTSDPDISQTHFYSLAGADSSSFSLSGPSNSVLSQAVPYFDFEAKSSYSFTVRTTDQNGAFFDQPITVTIIDVDDPPQALADTATVPEDILTPVFVLNNDTDIDGGVAKLVGSVTQPANGTVVITGGGSGVSYASNLNFCGTDSFTYTLTPTATAPLNPATWPSTATVSMSVQCTDDAPVAVADTLGYTEDTGTVLTVLANDTDVDCPYPNGCGPISIASITPTTNGTAAINVGQQTVTYTPNMDYCGPDSFTYTLTPGGSTTTVNLTSSCVNDVPNASNLSAPETYTEDTTLNLTNIVVTDVDGPAITAILTLSDVDAGSLTTASGSTFAGGVWTAMGTVAQVNALLAGVQFVPAANYNNNFTIATSVTDGNSPAITGTKVMTGIAVNDPPTATNLSAAETYTEEVTRNLIDIVVTDLDVPATPITAILTLSNPSAGTLTVAGGGSFAAGVWSLTDTRDNVNLALAAVSFVPAANFNGNFNIATSISDGSATITGTKVVTGTPVNDAPTATNLSASENYDEDVPQNLVDIVISDIDNATVTATLTIAAPAARSGAAMTSVPGIGANAGLSTGTSNLVTSSYNPGTGVWTASGATADVNALLAGVLYNPPQDYNATFSITTSVSDGTATITGTKVFGGAAANDPPSATNLSAGETFTEDTFKDLINISVADTEGDPITATLTLSTAAAGTLTTAGGGSFAGGVWTVTGSVGTVNTALAAVTFFPAANFNTSFTIATSVSDGGATLTGTKPMTGVPINDVPEFATPATLTVDEDTGASNLPGFATPVLAGPVTAVDENSQTLVFTITGNTNSGLFAVQPALAVNGTLTFTLAANATGTSTITATLFDNGSPVQSVAHSFDIIVTNINDAPVITSTPPAAATEDTLYTYTAARTDVDGPTTTWSLSPGNTCAGATMVGATYSFTPAGPVPPAMCAVGVRVCDGGSPNLCVDQNTIVSITAVNDAPVITSDAPDTVRQFTVYTYSAVSSDADGPGATWSKLGTDTCPGSAIGATTGVYTFTAPAGPTTCTRAIQICDNAPTSLCAAQTTTITVNRAISILTVGADGGNRATQNYVPTVGSTLGGVDLVGSTVAHTSEAGFNALTPAQLAAYDVVMTQWSSSGGLDLGSANVQAYVMNGGGLFLDGDYANYNDLSWVGITGAVGDDFSCNGPWTFTAAADPVLRDALPASPALVNCHGKFPNFDPSVFVVFMTDGGGGNAAVAGEYGAGRIILTGPDHDYHATNGSGNQQYQLLLNSLEWLAR